MFYGQTDKYLHGHGTHGWLAVNISRKLPTRISLKLHVKITGTSRLEQPIKLYILSWLLSPILTKADHVAKLLMAKFLSFNGWWMVIIARIEDMVNRTLNSKQMRKRAFCCTFTVLLVAVLECPSWYNPSHPCTWSYLPKNKQKICKTCRI